MTMTELKQYMAEQKRIKVIQWNKERQGNHCQGFTQKEFEQSMEVDRIKSRTRRTHSKGNLWVFNDTKRQRAIYKVNTSTIG